MGDTDGTGLGALRRLRIPLAISALLLGLLALTLFGRSGIGIDSSRPGTLGQADDHQPGADHAAGPGAGS